MDAMDDGGMASPLGPSHSARLRSLDYSSSALTVKPFWHDTTLRYSHVALSGLISPQRQSGWGRCNVRDFFVGFYDVLLHGLSVCCTSLRMEESLSPEGEGCRSRLWISTCLKRYGYGHISTSS